MNNITASSIKTFILEYCQKGLKASGIESATVADDFDLLAEGLVDSLGIIQLIAAIEQKFQISVDLEKLDADQLTRIGPLSQFIAENADIMSDSR